MELAHEVRHEERGALQDRHDDERAPAELPVDFARDGFHALGDLAGGVTQLEFHDGDLIGRRFSPRHGTPRGRVSVPLPCTRLALPRVRGVAEADAEDAAAPLEANSPSGLEAEVLARGQQRQDLLALAPGHRLAARPREGTGQAGERHALELFRAIGDEARAHGDGPVLPEAPHRRRDPPNVLVVQARALPREARDFRRQRLDLACARAREPAPHAVPRQREVAVGGVAAEPQPAHGQELQDRGAAHRQQRPHDAVVAALARARAARQSAAALLGEEKRLDRVVALVGRRDERGARLARHLRQRGVADVPRRGLRREPQLFGRAPRVAAPGVEGEAQPTGVVRDEGEVAIGLAAPPAVVHVADGEAPAGAPARLRGAEEERQRVGASRHGQEQGGLLGNQAGCGGALQGGEHGVHADNGRPFERRSMRTEKKGGRRERNPAAASAYSRPDSSARLP